MATQEPINRATLLLALSLIASACSSSTEQTLAPLPGDASQSVAIDPAGSIPLQAPGTPGAPGGQLPAGEIQAFPPPGTGPGIPALQPGLAPTVAAAPVSTNPAAAGSIRFMPVIGAPVAQVTPLSRQLAVEARNRGLTILSASDNGGDNVLKGYFSADTFDGKTTVFFVWDVLDAVGNRLHRIQGQEETTSTGSDAWASVPPALMEKIASRTLSDYTAWRATRRG